MRTANPRQWRFAITKIGENDIQMFLWEQHGIMFRLAKYVTVDFKPSRKWSGWANDYCVVENSLNAPSLLRRMRNEFPFLPLRIPGMTIHETSLMPTKKTLKSLELIGIQHPDPEPKPLLTAADFLPRVKFDIPDKTPNLDQSDRINPKPRYFDFPIEGTDID